MSMCFKRFLVCALALCLLAAAGCGGPSDLPDSPGQPVQKDQVTVGISQDLDSLDPHKAVNAGTDEVLFNIFEGLMKAAPDGGVIPAVASAWEMAPDGTAYTFTLREGVTFHSGAPVTVEDVLYSLRRCAGADNGGVPLDPAFAQVTGISSDAPGKVTVTLAEPSLEFLNAMTAAIIPKDSGDRQAASPVGTGPFAFASYAPKSELTVTRYRGYWGTAPRLGKVTFKIITDVNTRVMGLKGGTLDMVIHMPNTMAPQVEDDFTILQSTMKLVQALYLNNSVEPFDDVLVRQAMYHAVNVPEIIEFVCDGAGVATGTSMYPAFTKYFLPELARKYPFDQAKARQLLAQAGYPDGFDMTITVPSEYDQHVDTGLILAQQLEQVGIRAQVQEVPWATWVSDVYKGRQFEATVSGIAASDMTAREMLERYSSDHSKNFINFSDGEFDDVVARAAATLDDAEQVSLYKRAQEILNEQAGSLWLQDLCELVVMAPGLDGMVFYPTYVLDMSTVYYK